MKNSDALAIYNNAAILKKMEGFTLARAIVLNLKKIETELIDVIKAYIEDKEDKETPVKEILDKDCEIVFIKISEENLPENTTVEQYSLLSNWF